MQADTEMLRAFARSMDDSAQRIATHDVSSPFADAEGAARGTSIPEVNRRALDTAMKGFENLALRLAEIGRLAKGAGENYDVSEHDFRAQLSAMDVPR
ncbi:hypothetical protein DW322_13260 [Rhodococcus rhodnii]|uniref:Uncharacterized protein n=2 Tax=Rhodococcus rhodnii TaxID=38312 RepID=R7WKK6_9NOCA|nr:hypothetical protein [Rhodococcus rhodnii]EOM75841.1 hypothetical protein Rrhod_2747 [Rhodococcus rhodnii LMG 5362]TXG91016.1 hypothetical protein DW322_13260 [Rhodococcus rhodnii]